VLPPVDPDLAGLVDRRDEQPDLDRQQLDVEQIHADVARDHDPLVENAFEDVGQVRRLHPTLGRAGRAAGHREPSAGHRPPFSYSRPRL